MPYRQANRRANIAEMVALIALVFAVAANAATGVQAYRNCKNIELVKANARSVLAQGLADMKSGKQDKAFQNFYGNDWVEAKREAIHNAEIRIAKFNPDKCSLLIH